MTDDDSLLFVYVVPFVGVILVAVGIGSAVTGGYALLEQQSQTCGNPTIAVESPEETHEHFGANPPIDFERIPFEELSRAERDAFEEAVADAVGEAEIAGSNPNRGAFLNGTLVVYEGETYYTTIVAENTCFSAPPLQFPLGVFSLALGVVAILAPPAYRRLVALDRESGWRVRSDEE